MQEPDFQENEYTYDDMNLEGDIGSGKYFLLLFFVNEVFVSHGAITPFADHLGEKDIHFREV